MAADERPYEPPLLTRAISNATVGTVGFLCRSFLYALSRTEVHGLDHFLALVDERSDPERRERGLITGRSNSTQCELQGMMLTRQQCQIMSACMYIVDD